MCVCSGGDPWGQFNLEYLGGACVVMTSKTLDREEREHYLLNITATDGTFMAETAVGLTVLDANDNSPVCEEVSFKVLIYENGSVLGLLPGQPRQLFTTMQKPGLTPAAVCEEMLFFLYIFRHVSCVSLSFVLQGLYAGTVPENGPAGKFVLQVSASDPDSQSNAEIVYQLSGDGAESFRMHSTTGRKSLLAHMMCLN